MDANDQIFPLAFAIVDGESNASWHFFFTKLKESIGDGDQLAIISDRNNGIINTVKEIYPNVEAWLFHGVFIA